MPTSAIYEGWSTGPWARNGWGAPQLDIGVDGVGATAGLGSVLVVVGKAVSVTGVGAVGGIGTPTFATTVNINVTGVSGAANLGSIEIPLQVSGFSATGQIGTVLVWGQIDTDQTPNWNIIEAA
tara:strand:+ start:173 stop:544 length:372 start_codon:yes stop_codon:yes gene_type:complete